MVATWLVVRAEIRRRRRSWLVLAVLVALAGGFVLATTAAGRRTVLRTSQAARSPWRMTFSTVQCTSGTAPRSRDTSTLGSVQMRRPDQ